MAFLRVIYKLVLLIPVIFIGAILAIILLRNTMPTQGFISWLAQTYHQIILTILGVKITVTGDKESGNVLFVPNHISWLDISIIGALSATHFLAKAEIKNWPVIGLIATRAGTLYIKRGIKNSAEEANETIHKILSKNDNVVLFAEGTTSNGTLKKFHGRLMQSAIDAGSVIQPIAIFYPAVTEKNSTNKQNKINENILFIDDMSFLQSVFNVLSLKEIPANIHFLPPIHTENRTRKELATQCYENIYKTLNKD